MATNQKYRFPFASYPAIRLALFLATGIAIDYQYNLDIKIWLWSFGSLATLYLVAELLYKKSLSTIAYNLTITSYLITIVSFGGCWHSFLDYREPAPETQVINTYTWEELTFAGTIEQIKQTSTGKYQVDVRVDSTIFPDQLLWPRSYKLRAVLNPDNVRQPPDLTLGNRLTFVATVYPLEEKRNPGQFDYKQYLASQGIYIQVGIQSIERITPSYNKYSWTSLRAGVLSAIENNFSKHTTALAKALLIGYKNELDRNEKISFSRAGLAHIMAVSGLHVGFILAPFWVFIPFLWRFRYGKHLGLAGLIILLWFYAGLTGFSASVTRASLVGVLLTYGKLFHKVRDSKNLTAVAALIILLINPGDLFSIGFQLSFAAVYVILLIAPVIQHQLPSWIKYRWYGSPIMVVIISFIVQIGLFPLLAYYFGEFSIAGPLANAFVVPLLGIAVPFALLLLLATPLMPATARLLNTPVDIFLELLNSFVNIAAHWPWSWIQVHIEGFLFFGIWIAAIFFVASVPIPRIRWKMLSILLFLLCIEQTNMVYQKLKPAQMEVLFFDVGQGDAALVTTPNDKHFLIDTGRWQPDYNSAKYVIIPYLKEQGISKLDAIFLSHPHADHIGGINELIDTIPIDTIYNSGTPYDSQLYKQYHLKAAQNNIPVVSLSAGDLVSIDPTIRLFVYGPADNISTSNVNNRSLVLELVYGKTEFLFSGDAELPQEKRIITNYPGLTDTDFLKVAHHGSKTSSSSEFLKTTTAQSGVVSLSKQNRFKHPHRKAVLRLRKYIPIIHFTSLEGAIKYSSNGYHITKEY